jgi:glucokinase
MTAMATAAGVDLGGTKIQTVVTKGARGEIAGQSRLPTPQTGAEDVIEAIAQSIREALANSRTRASSLTGIGIGAPGEINQRAGTVGNSPNLPGFQTDAVPLAQRLRKALGVTGVRVKVDNDVRVAILGELERGAGKDFGNFLGVWVGTGVGGGLVLNRKLIRGRGNLGEIGHTVVKDAGRECSCGRNGHLESYAGRGRIALTAERRHKHGEKTDLFKIQKRKGKPRVSSGVVADALDHGDAMTHELIDEAVWALGVALGSAQNLLDLEAIIIGGGLGDRLGDPFVSRIEQAMRPQLFVPARAPAMLKSGLGDFSGAVGGSVLAGG